MPTLMVCGKELRCEGRIVRIARLAAPWYESIEQPERLIHFLQNSPSRIDMFTFFQRVPHIEAVYGYYWEPYSVAVIETESYDAWWRHAISKRTRQSVNKALRLGVEVRQIAFDDEFVRGMCDIYNETPVRQGKRFPHYGKSFAALRAANATFLEKSAFIGAYIDGQLIGFVKLVFEREFTDILQLLAKVAHRDKAIPNLLLAKAVELCAQRECRYLAYGDWGGGSLGDFKRHNGFIRMDLPCYYVPLTAVGRVALRLRLHRRFAQVAPDRLLHLFRALRKRWYEGLAGPLPERSRTADE